MSSEDLSQDLEDEEQSQDDSQSDSDSSSSNSFGESRSALVNRFRPLRAKHVIIYPSEICLRDCYDKCYNKNDTHRENKRHGYSFKKLISQEKYTLVKRICKYLFARENIAQHQKDPAFAKKVYSAYALAIYHGQENTPHDWQQCAQNFKKAIEKDNENADLYYKLAVVLDQRLAEPEAAKDYYKRALRLDPRNSEYNLNFALCLTSNGEYERSLKYWKLADLSSVQDRRRCGYSRLCAGRDMIKQSISDLRGTKGNETCAREISSLIDLNMDILKSQHKSEEEAKLSIKKCFDQWFDEKISIGSLLFNIESKDGEHVCLPKWLSEYMKNQYEKYKDQDIKKYYSKRDELVEFVMKYIFVMVELMNGDQLLERVEADMGAARNNMGANKHGAPEFEAKDPNLAQISKKLEAIESVANDNEFLNKYHECLKLIDQQTDIVSNQWSKEMEEIDKQRKQLDVC